MSEPEIERLRAEIEAQRAEIARQQDEVVRLVGERGNLVAQVMQAEEQTRRKVAQNLHDDALQSLLAAHQELLEAAPGRTQVTRAHEVVGRAIERLREALNTLHPVKLEQGGLEAALGAVGVQVERQGKLSCTLRIDPEAVGAHDALVFSIGRELMTNAAKHSGATHVDVDVTRSGDRVRLEVADDGDGIAPGRRDQALREGHLGLASITQRIEALGGEFALGPGPDGGTRAVATFPVTTG